MAVYLDEGHVRQAVAGSLKTTMTVPQAAWGREFVEESVLAELTLADAVSSTGTSTAVPTGTESASTTANNTSSSTSSTISSSDTSAATEGSPGGSQVQVRLAPGVLELIEQFQQAAAVGPSASSSAESAHMTSKATDKRSNSRSKKHSTSQSATTAHGDGTSIVPAALEAGAQQLQGMFGQLLQENYQEVEYTDVIAFGVKLLQELAQLVEAAAAAQQPDAEGLCQLCEREMPLTKHHLIPRDVHKDFKKRGFGFHELQAGLMVCRPCHSAIHRAVPDNKELALHYRTLSDLQQHKDIANFASWARRQRPTHKVDVQSAHFRYRR